MIPDFSSLRVLEIGTAVSVPLMAVTLRNLGAEVIKIESRQKPDGNRVRVRKGAAGAGAVADESFPLWHEFNGGKKSVLLNLKSATGRELFLKLVAQSDLLLENFAPGWMARIDLSIGRLHAVNPRLIVVSASGYGQEGPKAQQRVYAPVMTALGGQEALVGEESGEVTGAMPIAFGDFNAAFNGVFCLFAALCQRERTGLGCVVDLAQIEAVTATLGEAIVDMQLTGARPVPTGNHSPWRVPHGIFPCAGDDQWVALSIGADEEWARFAALVAGDDAALGRRCADPGLTTLAGRLARRAEVEALVADWTARQERALVPARLQTAGLRAAEVYESDEMERDPHYRARQFTVDVAHPRLGAIPVTSTPWRFDGATATPRGAGPALGEHTHAVLGALCGLDAAVVDRYLEEGHLG